MDNFQRFETISPPKFNVASTNIKKKLNALRDTFLYRMEIGMTN